MNKSARHFAIKEIIQHNFISGQEELVNFLKKRGIEATQATLSRDMAELGVVRVHTSEGAKYSLAVQQEEKKITPLIVREVLSIDHNESMLVIRTLPGRAPGVASYIDSLRNSLIMGTVAGDDTVFITPTSTKKISAVEKFIKELLFE
jgi:transcriptional regulator of arginine metabolism